MEVKGEEIFGARGRRVLRRVFGIGLEVTISVVVRERAFQSWESCILQIHDSFDISWCHLEQSGVAIP